MSTKLVVNQPQTIDIDRISHSNFKHFTLEMDNEVFVLACVDDSRCRVYGFLCITDTNIAPRYCESSRRQSVDVAVRDGCKVHYHARPEEQADYLTVALASRFGSEDNDIPF